MKKIHKPKIALVYLAILVLGLITNSLVYAFSGTTKTSPANITYDSTCVGYSWSDNELITKTTSRGFPLSNKQTVTAEFPIEKSTSEGVVVAECGQFTGSNTISSILSSWRFYANWLVFTLFWLIIAVVVRKTKTH